MSTIATNLKYVRDRIARAAERSGRSAADITLVAITKTVATDACREAYAAGQRIFGENYAQELAEKAMELADLDIRWHFTGHLQSNKAKLVAPLVACVETIDSFKLADALDQRAKKPLDVLIEVHIGGEESKSGVAENALPELVRDMAKLGNLRLKGLMVLPPFELDAASARPYFQKLRALMEHINEKELYPEPLTELSMGMSHDFEVAIEEGATIVRVGTAIFGERT